MKSMRYRMLGLATALLMLGAAAYAQKMPKSAKVVQETKMGSPGKEMIITSTVYWKGSKLRAESQTPMGNTVLLSDGKQAYSYTPATKSAVKVPPQLLKGLSPDTVIQQIDTFKKGKKGGTEKIIGYKCDIYTGSLSTNPQAKSTYKAWLMQSAFAFPLKLQITGAQGNITIIVKQLDLKYNPKDSLFQLPKGTKVQTAPQGGGMMGMPGGGAPPGR